MKTLRLLAGRKAYKKIKTNGLSQNDISAVFGASGAAKWLTIYGLDSTIFGRWLSASKQPIDLFGTSVGAFKLAAAAQSDSTKSMALLAEAYIEQHYVGRVTVQQVALETNRILNTFITSSAITNILKNKRYNFNCGAVICNGLLSSKNINIQKLAMAKAFLLSLAGRKQLRKTFHRAIFHTGRSQFDFLGYDGFTTQRILLNHENFRNAILASGSIPIVMPGVNSIEGGPSGIYRDGGILDYHPVPSNIALVNHGIVLYPHFYTFLKECWFDKFISHRRVTSSQLDNVLLIGPSDNFVASLPGRAIPDRKDFYTFKNNDYERISRWNTVKDRSLELGEEFLQLTSSGDIAERIELIN